MRNAHRPTAFGLVLGLSLAAVASPIMPSSTAAAPDGSGYCADREEAAFLDLINRYRAENGLEPLGFSRTLSEAAESHSSDMAATGYFDHTMSDGTTVEQNIRFHGYDGGTYGENIAAGTDTAAYAFETWRYSPTHNENMLRPAYGAIGIGRVQGGGSGYGWYWTTIFGGELDEPASICADASERARTVDDVNLRLGPGPEYDIARAVPAGVEFPVVGEEVNGYLPVEHDGETVWVAQEFLAVEGVVPTAAPIPVPEPVVSVTETVTLRGEPNREAASVGMIPAGDAIEITGEAVAGFLPVTWEGSSGWVDATYIGGATEAPQLVSSGADHLAGASARAVDALNLRASPSREAEIVTVVPAGSELPLTGNRENGYFEVRLGETVAWADAAYLRS